MIPRAYAAYGAAPRVSARARTRYAGAVEEASTGWYVLDERPYDPKLRRFLAPDSNSPFDRGGLNRYAYCGGDPISRIDPTGRAWMDWLRRHFRRDVPVQSSSAGQAASASSVEAAGIASGASTPSTVTTLATGVRSIVENVAAVGAATLAAGERLPDNSVLGLLKAASAQSLGTDPRASYYYIGRPPGRLSTYPAGTPQQRRNIVEQDAPASIRKLNGAGKPDLKRSWIGIVHPNNPSSVVWAADTKVNLHSYTKVYRELFDIGFPELTVYTGTHGEIDGQNWNPWTGRRLDPEPESFNVATRHANYSNLISGGHRRLNIVDTAALSRDDFQQALSRRGVHVIGFCFGIADEVVAESLNLKTVTLYVRKTP